jgi:ketosteroid isomerase-like protein
MMSGNLDLVRSIYAAWERGDFSSVEWSDPEMELVIADGPAPRSWTGPHGPAARMSDFLNAWDDLHAEGEEYRAIDGERVIVLAHPTGRGKTSGIDLGHMDIMARNCFTSAMGR